MTSEVDEAGAAAMGPAPENGGCSDMGDGAVLRVDGLSGYYGPVPAVRSVSLAVASGATVGVVGANGAGKSTLLKAIAGLVASSGAVELNGRPVQKLSTSQRYRLGMGFVPQEKMVIGGLTVRENLKLSWMAGRRLVGFDERVDRVIQLFPQLHTRLGALAADLSGGQRQMLAISRGLAVDPLVLLLDEPTAGLAPVLVTELSAALAKLRGEGLSMLLVEQNVRVATRVCECIFVMSGGRIVWQGAASMLGRDVATQLYLGADVKTDLGG